ncbi:U3 small nucleolar ribonucleoprotein complex, subunit Mpp10 [Pseudomassariella vexata]|uniref:U3 small nucleolar ribonucleoprotein protein MPP10 n=1 Tax=Pseudomassariella vexata TaxID=1141098 RepID=A0A1Y2DLM7_9PEZI|nr:U3 small nucleolar ribonucleoprotein complex, subunit Mpp10 [Pseudomassariella vexata]ORY59615.1 U3 small nucleolar ribonucleo protein complex, subunit Mpp10 [Pseudomassariella vexata]
MAGPASTSSSMTSTSHTLTHAPGLSFLSASPGLADMLALFDAIRSGNRHGLLQPTASIPNASLQLAKATLDGYAGQVSDEQQQRLIEANKKRKRADDRSRRGDVLKIRKLHVDGFESGQVWQQARRIISSALEDSKEALKALEESYEIEVNGVNGDNESLEFDRDGLNTNSNEEDEKDTDDPSGPEEEVSGEEDGDEVDPEGAEEGIEDLDEVDGQDEDNEEEESDEASEELVEDPNGLNDGFFSIDDFNKQTQWFENQDAKADPNTDVASEDEEINWHADPMTEDTVINGKPSKNGHDNVEDELPSDIEDEVEEGGPTFGNMDLDAPEGESDDEEADEEMEGGMGEFNANDVFYKDFFAPPPKKGSRNGKPRKFKESRIQRPGENDIERAMADVRRDLFDDESDHDDSDTDALSEVSAGDPKSRKSAHERRQAKLAEEIRRLEAENVAEKKWTLAGEARAADRPKHSLLEEDLDFEHIGKPVTVITPEMSESIEEMIKRRILAQEFDEVMRRRPDSLDQTNTRRGLVELDDTKAKQSLAEIYEEEHIKSTNPDSYVSQADEKIRKEEQEIEQMWKEVSAKLDALSSWHYKPKPAAPSLTVVADVATISMEDAQPTTAQGVRGGDNTLAPQEIYKAGKDTVEKGEVVAKSGLPVARQELSRDDKTRRRRRAKERIRKAGGIGEKKLGGKAKLQKDTFADLKKGGVKVINKKGEVLDVEGNKAKATKAASSGSFKL